MQARAIFWTAPERVEYRELELREPGPGEILIEAAYSLISPGTEREWLSSDAAHVVLGTTFPFVPGYSVAGRIAGLGLGVDGWAVGDPVVSSHVVGAHASHTVVPQDTLFRVPDGVPLRQAVFFNLGMTAAHTVRLAGVRPGESLAIVGQGPIGMLATQIARAQGAHPILALELDETRRTAALAHGATHAVAPSYEDAFATALAELDGGARAAIDLTGAHDGAGIDVALRATAPLGTIVLSTGTNQPVTIDYGTLFIKGITMIGAFVNARPAQTREDTRTFLHMLATGAVTPPDRPPEIADPADAEKIYARVLAADRDLTAPVFAWNPDL